MHNSDRDPVNDQNDISDNILMDDFQKGDNAAFDKLYLRYYLPIVHFICVFTKNLAQAQELGQDVFVRVIERRDSFDPKRGSFRAWVFSIAFNKRADFGRSRSRWMRWFNTLVPARRSPLNVTFNTGVEHTEFEDALDCLKNDVDRAIASMLLAGSSRAEIACALRISITTVDRRLAKIRDILAGHFSVN